MAVGFSTAGRSSCHSRLASPLNKLFGQFLLVRSSISSPEQIRAIRFFKCSRVAKSFRQENVSPANPRPSLDKRMGKNRLIILDNGSNFINQTCVITLFF